jgi:hypothetical protein
MSEHSFYDIERELRRIGVDTRQLGGLASSTDISYEDFLTWLRRTPTSLGHAAFMHRLETDGPRPGESTGGVPPRDISFQAPDLDVSEAFMREIKRVLPSDMVDHGWAIVELGDEAEAVAKLKALPDRAGWDLVSSVLPLVKVLNEDEP